MMSYVFDIAIFIVVLGELVFFHELGHFLAAKACGIYCERFSLGMPPRLFGIRYGETDYCIGLLPIGGYVKMAGQEDVPMSEEERQKEFGNVPRERWFMNKPVWQRIIVIVAGPLMNVVLAVVLYAGVAGVGGTVPESKVDSRIGRVDPDSPASSAPLYTVPGAGFAIPNGVAPDTTGWRTGDRIVSVNGARVTNIQDVGIDAVLSGGEQVIVALERTAPDGAITRYLSPIEPRVIGDEDHARFGVAPFFTALVGGVVPGMPAASAGICPGDEITRINGEITDAEGFVEAVSKMTEAQTVHLDVTRGTKSISIELTPTVDGQFKDIVFDPRPNWLDLTDDDAKLSVVQDEPGARPVPELHPGERITAIDGTPANMALLKGLYREHKPGPFTLTARHPSGPLGLFGATERSVSGVTLDQILEAITPFALDTTPRVAGISKQLSDKTGLQRLDRVEQVALLPAGAEYSPQLALDFQPATAALLNKIMQARAGGSVVVKARKPSILWGLNRAESTLAAPLQIAAVGRVGVVFEAKEVFYRVPPSQVLPEAIRLSYQAIERTIRTVQLLITGKVSTRDLGGPLMIFQVTTQAARAGYLWLLEMTAFISINLAVFNLLPLPVLDGGHLVFLTVEGVRRKPISAKITEWVQQAGLILIIALMLYVTFNDVRRWIENSILP